MDLILGRGNTGPVYPWFGQAIRDGIALAVENYAHYQKLVGLYRQRYAHYSHGTADQAIVGLGGHLSMRPSSQDAKAEFLPHFRATSFGQGVSMDSFMQQTPLTVGSPQEIIDLYAGLRDLYGTISGNCSCSTSRPCP